MVFLLLSEQTTTKTLLPTVLLLLPSFQALQFHYIILILYNLDDYRTMDNAQKVNNCINIPSSQTFGSCSQNSVFFPKSYRKVLANGSVKKMATMQKYLGFKNHSNNMISLSKWQILFLNNTSTKCR
jgi:hypothetical protein